MVTYVFSRMASPVLGALVFVCCLAAAPGGFHLEVQRTGAAPSDAVLMVRATGCHQPAKAEVWGTAEGLVDGQRRSIPLTLENKGEGVYAVVPQWPAEGAWVLSFTGTYRGRVSSVLVDWGAADAGKASALSTQRLYRRVTADDIEGALQRLAAHATVHAKKASGS